MLWLLIFLKLKGEQMSIKNYMLQHKSQLCIGLGLAFYAGSIVEIVKATVRATHKIDKKKQQIAEESMVEIALEDVKIPVMDIVKEVGPEYVPGFAMVMISTGLIIGGTYISDKSKGEWMTAYMLTKNAADLYKESTEEIVGETKEKKIQERVAEKSMERAPAPPDAECTGDGNTLYYVPYLYTYFRSSQEAVNAGIRKFEKQRLTQIGSLYEFLNDIGCYPDEYEPESAGNLLGWKDGEDPDIKVIWKERSYEPCGLILFGKAPHADFDKR